MSLAFEDPVAAQITRQGEPRVFTLHEAEQLLPLVRKLTAAAYTELEPVRQRYKNLLLCDPRIKAVEFEYESIVRGWIAKMERLGLVVNGLWMIDFDTGDGYLCWKYPELKLAFFHDYTSGFTARRDLIEIIEERAPDWA